MAEQFPELDWPSSGHRRGRRNGGCRRSAKSAASPPEVAALSFPGPRAYHSDGWGILERSVGLRDRRRIGGGDGDSERGGVDRFGCPAR